MDPKELVGTCPVCQEVSRSGAAKDVVRRIERRGSSLPYGVDAGVPELQRPRNALARGLLGNLANTPGDTLLGSASDRPETRGLSAAFLPDED